jgi:hypothetical protein
MPAPYKIDIVHGGEFRRRLRVKSRVIASDVSDANNAHAQSFH